MVIDYRKEVLKFILDSSEDENEKLAIFIAGLNAGKTCKKFGKTPSESDRAPVRQLASIGTQL